MRLSKLILLLLLVALLCTVLGAEEVVPDVTAEMWRDDPAAAGKALAEAGDEFSRPWYAVGWGGLIAAAGAAVTAIAGAVAVARRFASTPLVRALLGPVYSAGLDRGLAVADELASSLVEGVERIKPLTDGDEDTHRKRKEALAASQEGLSEQASSIIQAKRQALRA